MRKHFRVLQNKYFCSALLYVEYRVDYLGKTLYSEEKETCEDRPAGDINVPQGI